MHATVASTVAALNRIKRLSAWSGAVLRWLRAAALAAMTISVWALVQPQERLEQLGLGAVAISVAVVAGLRRRRRRDSRISEDDFVLAMEMRHGGKHPEPLTGLARDAELSTDWRQHIDEFRRELVRFELGRNVALATSLILPLAVMSVTLPQTAPSFRLALSEVSNVVSMLSRGATLRIVQGAVNEVPEKGFPLSADEPIELELLAQNLVEVSVTGGGFGKTSPVVELRRRAADTPAQAVDSVDGVSTGADAAAVDAAAADPPPTEDEAPTDDDAPLSTAPLPWEKPPPASSDASAEHAPAEVSTANGAGVAASSPAPSPSPFTTSSSAASASPATATVPSVFQRFQMMPVRDPSRPPGSNDVTRYSISFAVAEPVDLFIPQLRGDRRLATLKVRQLPIPKVALSVLNELEDPWPDDQPLNLRIQVAAENPLQMVRLLIKSGSRVSKELVANVMAEDRTSLVTEYRLILETYVESDLAQVEIVAEAIDRAVPTPLAGYSEPLRLSTASAYGRYRAALQTLRELKQQVDEALGKKADKLAKEALELASRASAQSERSPFFDGLDRVQIHRFEDKLAELTVNPSYESMLDLSQQLNDFLFEHEILDDRERDRDFFVAVRGLSRLVEQDPDRRPVAVKVVSDRIQRFLDDRQQRWAKRVERLSAEAQPPQWPSIAAEQPFHRSMQRVQDLDDSARGDPKARAAQLSELSKAVVDFRAWIEDLEAREDRVREAEERQRQEGLASARNTLRELQQRQGEVSSELDRAGERPRQQLDQQWSSTRMKQNANAKETKRLEGQMRSLSPGAGARIEAAHQAMEAALAAGNEGEFVQAESNSDLAGRLLRQAERAASQSQQKRRSRGRRRRVTGDNYYGQSVVGGDIEIKREYQVDRRYREDILEEIQNSNMDDEQRILLESYLRQVIR